MLTSFRRIWALAFLVAQTHGQDEDGVTYRYETIIDANGEEVMIAIAEYPTDYTVSTEDTADDEAASLIPVLDGVTCNAKDTMTGVISSSVMLGKFKIFCNDTNSETVEVDVDATEVGDDANGYTYTAAFDPYSCTGIMPDENNMASYSSKVEIYFAEKEMIGATEIFGAAHFFELKCTFQDEYDLTSELNGIDMEWIDEGEETFGLQFNLVKVDENWQPFPEDHVYNYKMGDKINYLITSDVAIDSLHYAPKTCSIRDKETGVEAEIFNHGMDTCGYSVLRYEMFFEPQAKTWNLCFEAFSLNPYGNHDYEIRCTASLCPTTGESVCNDAVKLCDTWWTEPCTCDNGERKWQEACSTPGAEECASCNEDEGWTLEDLTCVKQCSCENGVGRTGDECSATGAHECDTCNDGYGRNGDMCEPVCYCTHGNPHGFGACSQPNGHQCASCHGWYSHWGSECWPVCHCPDGTPKHVGPGGCTAAGDHQCASCNALFGIAWGTDDCEFLGLFG